VSGQKDARVRIRDLEQEYQEHHVRGVARELAEHSANAKLSGYCEQRVGTKMLGCPFEADSESPQREEE